jgi:predicted metal-dependent phosphoesterase TrpH
MEFTRYFSNRDRQESIYQYFPFDVPAGVAGVAVTMTHDGRASVVDLGLFDPKGFRGWSGSEREWVAVSRNEATPGYIAGEIVSGAWFVSIGLHQIEEDGINVKVTVEFGEPKFPILPSAPIHSSRPPARKLIAPKGWRWIPADFHSHSIHSDGSLSLEELASLGVKQGLELLAITDHNTVSHHPNLPEISNKFGINLLPGQEVTTASGHANAFGKIDWVDYRQATDKWLSDTKERGGLLSINHPVAYPCHWDRDIPSGLQFLELWHSSWDRKSEEPLEWWEKVGRPIPIGGSDFHRHGRDGLPGQPTTWILCEAESFEIKQSDVFDALLGGRVAISASVSSPVVLHVGDKVHVIDGEGCTLRLPSGSEKVITSEQEEIDAQPGIYQLSDPEGLVCSLGYVHR